MTILRMSVGGGLMIVLTLLLRAVLLHRLPKRAFMLLWGLCVLRLLAPFSLPVLERPLQTAPMVRVVTQVEAAGFDTAASAEPGAAQFVTWLRDFAAGGGVGALYALGLLSFVCLFARDYARCRRVLSMALPLGRRVQGVALYESDRIRTPLTYGVLRPRIVLPSGSALDEAALRDALTHELCHVRSRDVLKKLLVLCALCVHWFNPLVWVMFALCQRDIELCCDERVLCARGSDGRRGYALSLIALAERSRAEGPLCVSFGRRAVEERVKSIMKWRRPTLAAFAACALMALTMTGALAATSLSYAPAQYAQQVAVVTTGAEPWEAFGVAYDAQQDSYIYKGSTVRSFYDAENGVGFSSPQGAIDLRLIRNGTATDIRVCTQAEYDARTANMALAQPAGDTGASSAYAGPVVFSYDEQGEPDPVFVSLAVSEPLFYSAEEYAHAAADELTDLAQDVAWGTMTAAEADVRAQKIQENLLLAQSGVLIAKNAPVIDWYDESGDVWVTASEWMVDQALLEDTGAATQMAVAKDLSLVVTAKDLSAVSLAEGTI